MSKFCHLHCHTQYSLLDGAAKIANLVQQTKNLGMDSLAITDHGNMFGVPHFVNEANKQGVKPIIGCEFYLAEDRHDKKNKKRYHQILIAKNEIGYKNITKLCSLGYIEGYYYKPRIDQKLIQKYSEGLIATTCCLGSKICQSILTKKEEEAEKIFLEWLEIFGEDYYIELQRVDVPEMEKCNQILIKWSKKHNVKVVATNDVHYVKQEDSLAQDVLLCIQTGKDFDDPNRMKFLSNKFYLRSPTEMLNLFQEIPEAVSNTQEIASKIITPNLNRDILMPIYQLPSNFNNQDEYLKKLTYEGAKKIYKVLDDEVETRLKYELSIITTMGFAGYFLIVQDFINTAKQIDVIVGPGRGSVAGSLVAYCLGITDVDPLKYNLFFERFLNPERISMPDIDIDFDDEGRQKVIDYVVDKYGKKQVAHIITFGTMAARSSIRDVARVLGVPLEKADYMAKLVPEKPGTTLATAFKEVPMLAEIKANLNSPEGKVLELSKTLEGSTRHTGIHAAGVIIAPQDITDYIPVKIDKDSDLLVTQYDGSVIEDLGMLKMDFLGLKTLSIIKDTIKLIKQNRDTTIDIKNIPLNDRKTFQLYQRGETIGTFQFESEGMRSWLPKLKPTELEDLIAMNALYRPGPMQFIPNYINRKHGKEKIEYPHELLKDILQNTYGIMVYQEQIMKTGEIIAGYTLGEADLLRKAMGKKKADVMEEQREIFIEGAKKKNNIDSKTSLEIFQMMEKFAQYGFNRAHSTAYAIIAYQTAYLKVHYPAEYMASILTHNQSDINKISFFMEECRHMNLSISGPNINRSSKTFNVKLNDLENEQIPKSQILFGLAAIKGAGEAAISAIIDERNDKGRFEDIYDFIERVNLRKVNKKTLECLSMAGAFDEFEFNRKQYITEDINGVSFIEKLIQYGNKYKEEKNSLQQSLFGNTQDDSINKKPKPIDDSSFTSIEKLKMEKSTIGYYISGHPLDSYKIEIEHFCNSNSKNLLEKKSREVKIAGIVTDVNVKQTKRGQTFGVFTIEDYFGTINMALFGEDFRKYQHLLHKEEFLFITGSVQERYNNPDALEFKPKFIELLHGISSKNLKGLNIKLKIGDINEDLILHLEEVFKNHSGNCQIKLDILSDDNKMNIEANIQKYRIKPSNDFFLALKAKEMNIEYGLITT